MPRTMIVPRTRTVRDPFQDVRQLMRRAFDDMPGWFDDLPAVGASAERGHTLPLDVFESADGLTVEAVAARHRPDDVQVTREREGQAHRATANEPRTPVQGSLKDGSSGSPRRAEKAAPAETRRRTTAGRAYFLRERHQGPHARSILIGDGYDPDSVKSSSGQPEGRRPRRSACRRPPRPQPRHVAISGA